MSNAKQIKVMKRNGAIVDFDKERIVQAILKANIEVVKEEQCDKSTAENIAKKIEKKGSELMDIESIQDLVQKYLCQYGKELLCFKYLTYRNSRTIIREVTETEKSILEILSSQNKDVSEENSNKDARIIPTQRDYTAGEVSKTLSEKIILTDEIVNAHKNGILHVHDRDYLMHIGMFNCCLVNLKDMLDNGTVMNGKLIESPKGFQVACTVMTQIVASVASGQYGGQSIDIRHLGKYLRRTYDKAYIKNYTFFKNNGFSDILADEYSKKLTDGIVQDELKSGIQTIQYQINTLMTTNGQSPFVTLFLNIVEGDEYEQEVSLIVEEILKQRILGIKNKVGIYVTPAFPKLVYVLYPHNNLTGGKYDYITRLATRCTAKRMYPDYISSKKMMENYEGNVFSCMGCRSFLSPWKDEDGNYKWEGRFNQGVVSINLPQIGIVSKGDERIFWGELDKRLDLCYKALMLRHKQLKGALSDSTPIHFQDGAIARLKSGEKIDKLLYNGYSTISLGYIGIYEMTCLMKGCSHTSPIGKEFALRVMHYLKEKTELWKKETSIGFGLYGTPAESLCYRFAKIDKEKYGEIENVTDKGYYTNSYHVDVREPIDIFSKFTFEDEFQSISLGGCISYGEIPNLEKNPDALEEVIRFIYNNIQYAEFNTKSDVCHCCGFEGEVIYSKEFNSWCCPNCDNHNPSDLTVTRRTCGYLGEHYWNEGKTLEIQSRVLHM